jgi:hypothetical protein
MNILLIVAIPVGLVIVGIILNSIGLSFDQPSSSTEQDPGKRLVAEREAYRKLFDIQRSRSLTRQKRVGQFAWLVVIVFIGAFIWLYRDTVAKTTLSNQIVALQTVDTEEGTNLVLSVTLEDGSAVKYLVKAVKADTVDAADKQAFSSSKVSKWEIEQLKTAVSFGANPLPIGVALKISN